MYFNSKQSRHWSGSSYKSCLIWDYSVWKSLKRLLYEVKGYYNTDRIFTWSCLSFRISDFYPPKKLEGYNFGVVHPSIIQSICLSVQILISVPISQIWCIFGINDQYQRQLISCKFRQNQLITTWVTALDFGRIGNYSAKAFCVMNLLFLQSFYMYIWNFSLPIACSVKNFT